MIYALVYYPTIQSPRIHQFRKNYDPQADLIALHLTLMFPVPDSIGENNLVHHLEQVLYTWQPFLIHLHGVQISSDGYLFLLLQEGNADVIRLHDEIYTGLLVEYWRKDIPFVPHVTLGVFQEATSNREHVFEEARQLGIDQRELLDKLHLVKVNDDRTRIIWSREFPLTK